MKITYKSVTGEITEVEVSEEIGNFILDSRREEHNANERHRYHAEFSLDNLIYEGRVYASTDSEPASSLIRKEKEAEREEVLSHLTAVQRRRLEKVMNGMTIAKIARLENATFNSVKESVTAAQQKLKKRLLLFADSQDE